MMIRQAEPGDVASLRANCFSATPVDQVREWVEESAAAASEGRGAMLVAVDEDGEVAGNLSVTRQRHRLQRHRAEIGGFVVHPRWQGRGLARRLADAAAAWAREQGCAILEISCRGGTHAEDAYNGLGFTEWGRMPDGYVEAAGTFDQVNLFKPLAV